MKTPSLLLLLAAAAIAAPAAAGVVKDRCDAPWLKAAQKTGLGQTIADPDKYLTAGATIDIANPSKKLCDATAWHYLAVLEPASVLDPTTHAAISGVTLRWNDAALKPKWDAGLVEQIKILLAVDDLYQKVDALGLDALTKADAVVKAAVAAGVAVRTDGADLGKLKQAGLTGDAYVAEKGYEVSAAPAAAAGAAPPVMADLAAAFKQLVEDVPEKPATKSAKGAKTKAAPPTKAAKELKPGTAVLAFRKAIIALANEVRSAHPGQAKAAFSAADYEAAMKFLTDTATDTAIKTGDDSGAYPSAALSGLDYGLRNLIALRAAAVDQSLAEAKKRVPVGQSVAEVIAAAGRDTRLPENQSSATMAASVLKHMQGIKDYSDLNSLYDAKSKADPLWSKTPEAIAVDTQRKQLESDAAATTVVKTADGRALQYSIGGQKVTDAGINVAALDKGQGYRETIAEAIAQNIFLNPLSAEAQAALAAFRVGASGTVVSPELTPKQKEAAVLLPPIKPAIVVTAPATPYDALLKVTPAAGFFNFLSPKGNVTRYVSKINEDAARVADTQAAQRTAVEENQITAEDAVRTRATDAADTAQTGAKDARKKIASAASDPDLSAALATKQKNDALAAFDAKTAADVRAANVKGAADIAAARQKVLDDARAKKLYVDAASAADLAAKKKALNDTVDAAYSDGIAQAVSKLNAAYELAGSPQRKYAEKKSGYEGPYYKLDRVERYFTENWKGDKQKPAVEKCKADLGFKKDGDSGDFKDPSVDNVDKTCGVRDGLVALLASYKGTVQSPVVTAVVPAK